MLNANYNGRVGNNTTNTRYFTPGTPDNLWTTTTYSGQTVLTPTSSNYKNVYIPGNLYVDGSIINPSDLILKDNISGITTDLSDTIMKLKPSQFTFKSDNTKKVHYGFIAQELEPIFSGIVTKGKTEEETWQIDYSRLTPHLLKAIQELDKKLQILENNA